MTLTPIATRKGHGVAAVAEPSLNPSSHWGEVLAIEEMELIATTPGVAANTIVPIVHAANSTADIHQSARYVKPFYLKPDFVSNKVKVILACPAIAVKTTSSLFTKVLGFRAPTDFTQQDPFLYAGKAWTAGIEGTLVRVRSLVFHCPTLIDSSYDQTGKKSGAQLRVVPVTVHTVWVCAGMAGGLQQQRTVCTARSKHFSHRVLCSGSGFVVHRPSKYRIPGNGLTELGRSQTTSNWLCWGRCGTGLWHQRHCIRLPAWLKTENETLSQRMSEDGTSFTVQPATIDQMAGA